MPLTLQYTLIAMFCTLTLSACVSEEDNVAVKPLASQITSVQSAKEHPTSTFDTTPLAQTLYKKELRFHGIVKGINSYNETIFESGKIVELHAKEGQLVNNGELIAKLYSPILAEKLEQATARLKKSQAELKLTQQSLTRSTTLFSKKLISQQLFDEAKRDFNIAKQATNEAQAMVSQASNEFSDTAIKAKETGIVAKIYKREGDFVSPGEAVFRFESVAKQKVSFAIPEALAVSIRHGEQHQLYVPATGLALTATVKEKSLPTEDGIRLHTITFEVDSLNPELVGLRVILNYVSEAVLAYKVDYRAIRYDADNRPYIIKVAEKLIHVPISIVEMKNQSILITAKLATDSQILIGNEVSLPVNLHNF